MTSAPFVVCPLCQNWVACAQDAFSQRRGGGACFRESRDVDERLQREHLELLARVASVEDRVPDRFHDHVFAPVRRARGAMSRPIEYSVSYAPGAESWYRFSVAYADDVVERLEDDLEELIDAMGLFGSPGLRPLVPLLRSLSTDIVVQPMLGADVRDQGPCRVKLYLRLRSGCADAKARLIEKLRPGVDRGSSPLSIDKLLLVGVDLSPTSDEVGVKLYFTYDGISVDEALAMTSGHPFLAFVGRRRPVLRELLLIERMDPGCERVTGPGEIDLHMLRNGLQLSDILRFVKEHDLGFPMGAFIRLHRTALVVPTSVTFPLRKLDKMNLYYVLVGPSRES